MKHILESLIALFIALTFSATTSAQIKENQLSDLESGCEKIIKKQTEFSSDGLIRLKYITFCKSKAGINYMWFEAAAMNKSSFTGSKQAPWMGVELQNNKGDAIWSRDDAWLVGVSTCGGYEFHFHRLPADLPQDVYDVRVKVGATSGVSCKQKSNLWRDSIETVSRVIKAAKDCDTPELDPTEREICGFIKENAASAL